MIQFHETMTHRRKILGRHQSRRIEHDRRRFRHFRFFLQFHSRHIRRFIVFIETECESPILIVHIYRRKRSRIHRRVKNDASNVSKTAKQIQKKNNKRRTNNT